jgi:hypothetical protein
MEYLMTQFTTATNLQGPELSNKSASADARKYFNNFYTIPFNVSADTDAAIISFFEQYTNNKTSAKNLASAVLYTAMAQNINPLTVLSDFQSLPKGQLNDYLIAFLNINRVPTSTIGVRGSTQTSPYISRTILS